MVIMVSDSYALTSLLLEL